MAFNVNFYTFSKKENSTKQPSGSATKTISCVLKETTSIINPTLIIYDTSALNPYNLNYCYIATFGRYYFINDWSYIVGQWECNCEVDAMASFKTQIGLENKFVLRASAEENKSIIDTFYPSLARKTVYKQTVDLGYASNLINGIFILGVVNDSGSDFGSVSYYAINAAELRALAAVLYDNPTSEVWTQTFTGLTDVILRSIYDPGQFLVSCKYYPKYSSSIHDASDTSVKFGNYVTSVTAYPLLSSYYWDEYNYNISFPAGWVNLPARERSAPYVKINLKIAPFGLIELNPTDFTIYGSISIYLKIDYISGDARLRIYTGTSNSPSDSVLIYEATKPFAATINLTNVAVDVRSAWGGVQTMGASSAQIATGNIPSGIVNGIAGILDFVSPMLGSVRHSEGENSGFAFYDTTAVLTIESSIFPNENNAEFGRPLCATRNIATLADAQKGYFIKCADSDIEISGAMRQELDEIGKYFIDGFYYE